MSRDVPPGPPISSVAALRALRRDPIGLFTLAASYGDVSYLRLPRTPLYVLNHPDLVKEVLVTSHRDVRKGPTMDAAKRMVGESLLTSEGEHHRRQRRLIQPIFHHERIAGYARTMVEHAERWAAARNDGESLDLHAEMARLTLGIVAKTLFDADLGTADARAIGEALTDVLAQFNRVFSPFLQVSEHLPLPANRRFQHAKDLFDRTVGAMIESRRAAGPDGEDVLSLLLRAQEDGAGMTDGQVRDEAITLFLAGHETTSNALTWMWFLLSEHPETAERVRGELDDVLGTRSPTVGDIARLPFADAVLRESMRRYPPAWAIGRRALVDLRLGGYAIRAGSVLVMSPWLLHHDPRWWPQAWAFRPERWLDDDGGRPRLAYLPFGAGPRMCIGEDFAWMEAILVLASIGRSWRFQSDPSHRVEVQPVLTLRPRGGLPVTVRDVASPDRR